MNVSYDMNCHQYINIPITRDTGQSNISTFCTITLTPQLSITIAELT